MSAREKQLATRIRQYVLVMVLSVPLQGVFLVEAFESEGSTAAGVTWGVVLVFSATCAIVAGIRASRLSREYRRLVWGEGAGPSSSEPPGKR